MTKLFSEFKASFCLRLSGNRPPREREGRQTKSYLEEVRTRDSSMQTMLEVEPKVASKIQARARERGVSVDVYLWELIDQKGTESEESNGLSSQERVRRLQKWASGHNTNTPLLSDNAISRESIYGKHG